MEKLVCVVGFNYGHDDTRVEPGDELAPDALPPHVVGDLIQAGAISRVSEEEAPATDATAPAPARSATVEGENPTSGPQDAHGAAEGTV